MSDPYGPPHDPWDDPDREIQGWPANPSPGPYPGGPAAQPEPEYVECWRCGKLGIKDLGRCTYCRAVLVRELPGEGRPRRAGDRAAATPLVKVLVAFIGFLATLLVFFWFQLAQHQKAGHEAARIYLVQLLVFGLIDAGLLLLAWAWVGRPPPLPRPLGPFRIFAWATAAPVLLLALGLNYAYFEMLRKFLNVPLVEPEFVAHKDLIGWAILAVCVQPALVEELFFRYLALNSLRPVVGLHGAVLISAVMFGMAHIGNPLGIPILMVMGVVLGYVRVASGGLMLPMLMHFGNNFAVLFLIK